jgi:hypothetical protein
MCSSYNLFYKVHSFSVGSYAMCLLVSKQRKVSRLLLLPGLFSNNLLPTRYTVLLTKNQCIQVSCKMMHALKRFCSPYDNASVTKHAGFGPGLLSLAREVSAVTKITTRFPPRSTQRKNMALCLGLSGTSKGAMYW